MNARSQVARQLQPLAGVATRRPAVVASYVAAIVASFLWGSLYPAGKPAVAAVGPIQVTFCRALLACLTLGVIVLLRRDNRALVQQVRTRWRGILLISLLSFALSTVLGMLALGLLPASVNGLLNNTHPLWLAVGVALFAPPRRPALLVMGSLIALLGVGMIFFPDLSFGSPGRSSALSPLGVALSLAGSGVIAISTVVGRQVMRKGDPIAVSALASAAAIPILGVLTEVNGGFEPILVASTSVKLLLLYVGVGCTAINFTLWYFALQHLPSAQASAFQYLVPPIGVVLSALTLNEPLTASLIVGGALILGGLVATQASGSGGQSKQALSVETGPPTVSVRPG